MSEQEKSLETKEVSKKDDNIENKSKKEKTPEKAQSKSKKWFKELRAEVKKIVWPAKNHVIHNTGVVLTTVVLAMLAIAGLDFVFQFISDALIALG